MNSLETLKANIAARKEKETREAKERAENGGKTLTEVATARTQEAQERARVQARIDSRSGRYTSQPAPPDGWNVFLSLFPQAQSVLDLRRNRK